MKSEAVSNLFITFQSSSSVSSYVLPKISYTRQIILVIWKQRFEIFQERSQKVPLLLATSPLALLDRGIFYCVNQIFSFFFLRKSQKVAIFSRFHPNCTNSQMQIAKFLEFQQSVATLWRTICAYDRFLLHVCAFFLFFFCEKIKKQRFSVIFMQIALTHKRKLQNF